LGQGLQQRQITGWSGQDGAGHARSFRYRGAEGEEMISLRLAVPAVLFAAAVAGCFTYFVTPPPPPPRVVDADQRLPPTVPDMPGPDTGTPTNIGQRPSAEEQAAAAFQRAAAAIQRQASEAQASAGIDEPPITGHIPLPKRRPIPRP
jgi:hypothetical protein